MPPLSPPPPAAEFPDGASAPPDALGRREFLRLAGASAALASLSGCGPPAKTLAPYVVQPESVIPGQPAYFATAMPWEGYARGLIVEAHEGRPTKLEGNPAAEESRGATDAQTQASILALYDPDRSRSPLRRGFPATWDAFEAEWGGRRQALAASAGAGLALLTEPTTSPTLRREINRLLDRFPRARWYQHTALVRYDRRGRQLDAAIGEADLILALGDDFLLRHPASLRYAREFARRRRAEGGAQANRLYVAEAALTVTGAMADHRLAIAPERLEALLGAVDGTDAGGLAPAERDFAARLRADLARHAGRVLCLAGPEQDRTVRDWARACNGRYGSSRLAREGPALRSDGDPRASGGLRELAGALGRGEASDLIILGCNPAYTGAAGVEFPGRLAAAAFTAHLGLHADETGILCRWHLPESHYLEAWGDLLGYGGQALIQQPLVDPLYPSRSAAELVRFLADGISAEGYDLVRETWRAAAGPDFEPRWAGWLNRGVVDAGTRLAASPAAGQDPAEAPPESGGLTLLFQPDPNLADGRWANNAWLQELPRPFSTLVWDEAAHLSPELAGRLGLKEGDVIELACGGRRVLAPVALAPGQAEGCVLVYLGGGRTAAGSVGDGRGFDAYRLRPADGSWRAGGLEIRRTGQWRQLVFTQHHFTMDGRDLARWTEPGRAPAAAEPDRGSLFPAWPRPGHAWAMSIDLAACFGCNACVAACQAENNIPVVGPDQVFRGREMHWIRIARYFEGEGSALRVVSLPLPCMHCENAPCELVCPVGATVHSSEGLNQMVYNRCVGTRYCSNNCPYKVRRFNFYDYRAPADSPVHLQENPNVTVRERGVMEKCTYCVQRIDAARIAADVAGRPLRDGDIRTACQQACPAEAIVFGDLADPASAVSRRKRAPGDYGLLTELNTRPRTTYLPKLANPGPAA
ncbi:MAG TPA: 4Fe-4S dicluster domain-containing protein [Opitutaceae bacterium]|jgi:molybdopterin-containing oxidoreductase family iron-sulfur binding subunit|nr:4Fe-4S dicluster domain-containing protein [Opitutaceae bacterium]